MRVRCIRRFRDTVAGTYRDEGEVFEAAPERLEEINSTRYGQLAKAIEVPDEVTVEVAEEVPEDRRQSRRGRAKRTKE